MMILIVTPANQTLLVMLINSCLTNYGRLQTCASVPIHLLSYYSTFSSDVNADFAIPILRPTSCTHLPSDVNMLPR